MTASQDYFTPDGLAENATENTVGIDRISQGRQPVLL